jgi:hypothetical protein
MTRLVVLVYQSPLPKLEQGAIRWDALGDLWLWDLPRDDGNNGKVRGVFVRPLGEREFEKHVERMKRD